MQNNEPLQNIAIKVLNKTTMSKPDNHGFAVITILMMISIILTCVRILQECNKNKLSNIFTAEDKYALYGQQISEYSHKKGWFTKLRIKKVLRQNMSDSDYHQYGLSVLAALLDIGETLTQDEIKILVEASNV